MNDNNDSGQLSTIQHFQHSASYNQQGILGLLQLGPHVADPWLQNNSAIHRTSFLTSSSLSVGFFLPVFYSSLDFNDHILWDVPHRVKLSKKPLTKRMDCTL